MKNYNNTKECFLIFETKRNVDITFYSFKVIKEIEGFLLGEIIEFYAYGLFLESCDFERTPDWHVVKSYNNDSFLFTPDAFITIEEFRDRKINEILS